MTKLTWLGLRYEARAWLVMLVRRWMAEFTCYYPFFVSSVCATQHRGLTLVTVARATSCFAPRVEVRLYSLGRTYNFSSVQFSSVQFSSVTEHSIGFR